MKSYSTLRTLFGRNTLDASSANLTQGDEWMNDEIRRICTSGDYPFMHKDRTLTTTASTQSKALPYDLDSVSTVKVTVGTVIYSPLPVNSQREWDILNFGTYTSDAAERYFVKDGTFSLWPIPATSSNTITLNGKLRVADLTTVDDTSRTVVTLANNTTALTVSGGLTTQMVGFWIRPTFTTTANTGDGRWYEMSAIGGATTATLARAYGGVSIAAGTAASTIAQMPIIPEAFHDLPVLRACEQYWAINSNAAKMTFFGNKANAKMEEFNSSYKTNINNPVVDDGRVNRYIDDYVTNPNLYPTGLH